MSEDEQVSGVSGFDERRDYGGAERGGPHNIGVFDDDLDVVRAFGDAVGHKLLGFLRLAKSSERREAHYGRLCAARRGR